MLYDLQPKARRQHLPLQPRLIRRGRLKLLRLLVLLCDVHGIRKHLPDLPGKLQPLPLYEQPVPVQHRILRCRPGRMQRLPCKLRDLHVGDCVHKLLRGAPARAFEQPVRLYSGLIRCRRACVPEVQRYLRHLLGLRDLLPDLREWLEQSAPGHLVHLHQRLLRRRHRNLQAVRGQLPDLPRLGHQLPDLPERCDYSQSLLERPVPLCDRLIRRRQRQLLDLWLTVQLLHIVEHLHLMPSQLEQDSQRHFVCLQRGNLR